MPVGKGSIERAVKSQSKEVKTEEKKTTEKKAAPKRTAAKKTKNIHEEKNQVVSHIQCDLPVHLL